jgi:predicted Zn finger-like uncharacterized protein
MILTCPECSTRYLIEPTVLGTEGRMVRCSKCDNTWVQTPVEDAADPVEAAEDVDTEQQATEDGAAEEATTEEVDPFEAAAERRARRAAAAAPAAGRERRSRAAAVLWTLLIMSMVGVLGAGFVLRDNVIQMWPAAEQLYRMAGLERAAPGAGLGFRNVSWKASSQGDDRLLTIKGEVANISKDVLTVPDIQGVLFDKNNRELQRWTFKAPEGRLLPGENVAFSTELKNPAAGYSRLTIVFADSK